MSTNVIKYITFPRPHLFHAIFHITNTVKQHDNRVSNNEFELRTNFQNKELAVILIKITHHLYSQSSSSSDISDLQI